MIEDVPRDPTRPVWELICHEEGDGCQFHVQIQWNGKHVEGKACPEVLRLKEPHIRLWWPVEKSGYSSCTFCGSCESARHEQRGELCFGSDLRSSKATIAWLQGVLLSCRTCRLGGFIELRPASWSNREKSKLEL